jgi:hypothetical protein
MSTTPGLQQHRRDASHILDFNNKRDTKNSINTTKKKDVNNSRIQATAETPTTA